MGKKMPYKYAVIMSMAFYCTAQSAEQSSFKHQQRLRHKSVEQLVKQGIRPCNNELNCSYQNLTTVADLPKFIHTWQPYNLTKMNASHNHLQDESLITILTCAQNLQHLDFSHNEVHQLCTIPPHEQLQKLVLNDNHIKKLCVKNVFGSLKKLTTCLLHNNLLSDEDITGKDGYYPNIETIWFDHTALKESTIQSFIKIFPNLNCELIPGSNVVQEQYTRYEANYEDYVHTEKYVESAIMGGIITSAFTTTYGFISTVGRSDYWYMHNTIIAFNIFIHTLAGAFVGALTPPACIKLYSIIHGYYTTEPTCRYHEIHRRNVRPYPYLLGHRFSHEHNDPGQEESIQAPAQ